METKEIKKIIEDTGKLIEQAEAIKKETDSKSIKSRATYIVNGLTHIRAFLSDAELVEAMLETARKLGK